MEFEKVIAQNHTSEHFKGIHLTRAQIESIVKAGQSAPIVDELRDQFHISVISSERALEYLTESGKNIPAHLIEEVSLGGPVYFIISVKESDLSEESVYLYAGIVMGNMQLQATNNFLGYRFASEQKKVALIDQILKERLEIPQDFKPVQFLKVGYVEEDIKKRKVSHGQVLTNIIK